MKIKKLASLAVRFAIKSKRKITAIAQRASRNVLMFIASLFNAETRKELEGELNSMNPVEILFAGFICNVITIAVVVLFIYTAGV